MIALNPRFLVPSGRDAWYIRVAAANSYKSCHQSKQLVPQKPIGNTMVANQELSEFARRPQANLID